MTSAIVVNPTYATGDTIEALTPNTLRDNDLVLDARTGGDPGATGKVLKSNGTLGGTWLDPGTVSYVLMMVAGEPVWAQIVSASITDGTIVNTDLHDDAVDDRVLAAGAAAANLGGAPLLLTGGTLSDALSIVKASGSGAALTGLTINQTSGGTNAAAFIHLVAGAAGCYIGPVLGSWSYAIYDSTASTVLLGVDTSGVVKIGGTHVVWHDGNDGAASALDAGLFAGRLPGTTAGTVPFYDGAGKVANSLLADSAAACSGNATTATTATNSTQLGAVAASGYALVADKVPSGLIAMFRTAAAIPSGWTRETNMDGRIPVGAGTVGGVTFTEFANFGTTWTPSSGLGATNNVTATSSAIAASATVAPVGTGGNFASGSTHVHATPTITIGGTVDLTGTSATYNPPVSCVVFARH